MKHKDEKKNPNPTKKDETVLMGGIVLGGDVKSVPPPNPTPIEWFGDADVWIDENGAKHQFDDLGDVSKYFNKLIQKGYHISEITILYSPKRAVYEIFWKQTR